MYRRFVTFDNILGISGPAEVRTHSVLLWVQFQQWGVYTIQQTSSKCIQNTSADAGRLLDRVNTL